MIVVIVKGPVLELLHSYVLYKERVSPIHRTTCFQKISAEEGHEQ